MVSDRVPLRAMIDRYSAPPHGNAAALDAQEKADLLAYLLTLVSLELRFRRERGAPAVRENLWGGRLPAARRHSTTARPPRRATKRRELRASTRPPARWIDSC